MDSLRGFVASCEALFSFAGIRVIRGYFFGHLVVEGVLEADQFAEGGVLAREWGGMDANGEGRKSGIRRARGINRRGYGGGRLEREFGLFGWRTESQGCMEMFDGMSEDTQNMICIWSS